MYKGKGKNIYPPVMFGAPALLRAASRISVLSNVVGLLELVVPKPTFAIDYYRTGIYRFGEEWGYTDLLSILYVATKWLQPKSYLEIGVASGRSMSIVVACSPHCNITGIDLWKEDRLDLPRDNMKAFGHKGRLTLIRGSSHHELPKLNKTFDLILVDGDHHEEGAAQDLIAVIPMLPRGGILVFDDIAAPWLDKVWKRFVESNSRFTTAKYTDSGVGVGVAVKRA